MANQEHLDKLLDEGIDLWNQWRQEYPEIHPDLSGATLIKVNLCDADLSDTDLSRATLTGAILIDTHFNEADLSHAHLFGAFLSGANLYKANCYKANLSEAQLFRAYLNEANLSEANLYKANLCRADLSEANLYKANLAQAELIEANLHRANFTEASLSGASLIRANLDATKLYATKLYRADLTWANLHEAILTGANFTQAKLAGTIFSVVDLRQTKGLLEINHQGPSILDLHTIQLPLDGSALHFLRGAGVPDEWIDFYRTSMMHPIQYHSCFISYSSNDDILAHRLHADLQDQGVRCWFAPHDLKIGDKIRTRIDEAIHLQDKLLLLLSEHALASSWVEGEVEVAFEKEHRQQREVLFPVRLDESVMQTSQAWAANLRRTRHIGNFTCWADPQAYQQAFDQLLRDLRK